MNIKSIVIVFVVIVIAVSGGWFFMRSEQRDETALTLYGNIDIRQVELSFHDPEHIDEMLVKEGDKVKKGELLAVQDLERFQYAVESAEAKLEEQRQVVAKLEAGSRPEEIRKARADVNEADAEVVFADKEAKRISTLATKRLASNEEADRAVAALNEARARLKALKEVLELAVIGPRAEDIAAAKARLKADESTLKLAKKTWQDGHLYAPSDGVMEDRILEPGDMADANTPVYTLALTDPVWSRTYVPEKDLGKLRLGMPARITTDSYPGKVYDGWLGYLSPTAEFTPKAVETPELRTRLVYQLRVYICNPQDEIRLGMPVTVTIPLEKKSADKAAKGRETCQED